MLEKNNGSLFHNIFTTWMTDARVLLNTLVGREELIKDLLNGIRSTPDQSSVNHVIIIGPRGIGKSHVLSLIHQFISGKLEIPQELSPPISGWVSLFFAEEEYVQHNSLVNFLESLLEKLCRESENTEILSIPQTLLEKDDSDIWEYCFEKIDNWCNKNSKRIILLIDNIQKILSAWTLEDQSRFRAYLSNTKNVLIIGSTISIFDQIIGHKMPFYEFFEVRPMRDLTTGEMLELLKKRYQEDEKIDVFELKKKELEEKLPAIEILTGGNPRLVMFLYSIVTKSEFLEIESALKQLLEDLREYYVNRLDELPDQEKKILDTLAQMEGPSTPTEIAFKARLDVSKVNSWIKRLKDRNYIKPVKYSKQKNTRYDIKDRLFRIWRQTATRAGRARFGIIIDFLKIYYTPEEIERMCNECLKELIDYTDARQEDIIRTVTKAEYLMQAATGEIRNRMFRSLFEKQLNMSEKNKVKLMVDSFANDSKIVGDKEGLAEAMKAQFELNLLGKLYDNANENIRSLIKIEHYDLAVDLAEKLVHIVPQSAEYWTTLGFAAFDAEKYEKSFEAFKKATILDKTDAELWGIQASALMFLNRFEEAKECLTKGIKQDPLSQLCWRLLGLLQLGENKYEKAFDAFCKIEDQNDTTGTLQSLKASALAGLKRIDEAILLAEKSVSMKPQKPYIWQTLGHVFLIAKKYEDALNSLNNSLETGTPTADLWGSKAMTLISLQRFDEALDCLMKGFQIDANSRICISSLILLLLELTRHDGKTDMIKDILSKFDTGTIIIQIIVSSLKNNGRFKEALEIIEFYENKVGQIDELLYLKGYLLMYCGDYEKAVKTLKRGLDSKDENWDFKVGIEIALACQGFHGITMASLFDALSLIQVPEENKNQVGEYLLKLAKLCFDRNESNLSIGLFNTALKLSSWFKPDWFANQIGVFLRITLDKAPSHFIEMVHMLQKEISDIEVLNVLNPYIQAINLMDSKDLTILEKLFPEVQELVIDIINHVDSVYASKLRKLTML